ncbi:tetratricopeptide repeat protein [Psychroserpens luteolus]|uniref:tetratricopeptide repeat protein n=1 Tax=Psychroserpens luteolus TaxID=2855840 RepID=UPI001E504ED9|nr:tetratricopeptide repeat protein [Psychroserpens luteolus]MCD2259044.1 tetratricopeptide repeat protein [Psychroserpens luteolus]
MKTISLHNFKHTLRDIHTNTESRKFCFIIGAGASYKSGIPTGGQLAKKWFAEIEERYSDLEIEEWIKEVKLNKKDIATHYGAIYRKRFESDKTSGYEFLVQAMRSAKPTFGHIVLAQILTKAPGNCILTTNFDSLIESSIYQYTDRTPLVCGHESLSGYARPSNIHPLIIKIHRDLLLSPKSDPDEINRLDEGWKEPLDNIFSGHIPIVIGYGGNDGSLMDYFEKMNKPSNFFWCGHKESKPTKRVEKLIKKMNGFYIEIDGFDEMMQELLWVFDEIKPIKEELDDITKSRIEAMDIQLKEMNIEAKSEILDSTVKKELSAFEYSSVAKSEKDYEKRKTIYLEALEAFPKTAWLWNEFTFFLHFIKKDHVNLEKYYQQAISVDPENANNNENYAIFLHEIKEDYENAEKYYVRALSIAPGSVFTNGNYANFLYKIRNDYDNAEKYYLKALSSNPEHANTNGNYAAFLHFIRKDYDKAEKYFLKALSLDPEESNVNVNYAVFLYKIRGKHDQAEKHFLKALSIDSQSLIKNGNYANFLCDIREDYPKAEKFYQKALSINPNDANINGNYARFLLISNKKDDATGYLEKAFLLNNNEKIDLLIELWFYKYAHYYDSINDSENRIEELLSEGIRAVGWSFDQNVDFALKNGHPNPDKLKEFAKRITTNKN